jgi:hypothetical protein
MSNSSEINSSMLIHFEDTIPLCIQFHTFHPCFISYNSYNSSSFNDGTIGMAMAMAPGAFSGTLPPPRLGQRWQARFFRWAELKKLDDDIKYVCTYV